MKTIILFITTLSITALLQAQTVRDTMTTVTTTGIIDLRETKSGYQINEYFIELSAEEVNKYANKKVEVTGTLLVVEGIDPEAKIKTQGAYSDRYFIRDPRIRMVD